MVPILGVQREDRKFDFAALRVASSNMFIGPNRDSREEARIAAHKTRNRRLQMAERRKQTHLSLVSSKTLWFRRDHEFRRDHG